MNMIGAGGSKSSSRPVREESLTEMLALSDWKWFVPETAGLLAVIFLLLPMVSGSTSSVSALPHLFWIPVLLMSAQYGIMGGLFASVSASAIYILITAPPQSALLDFYAYAGVIAAQPCAWFGSSLVLGGLRTLHIHNQTMLQEQFDGARAMADDLADGLKSAAQEIERLEFRIASDTTTVASLLDSLARLELRDRQTMLEGIAEIIRYGVGATDFAIYLNDWRAPGPCMVVHDVRTGKESGAAVAGSRSTTLEAGIGLNTETSPLGRIVCHRLLPALAPGAVAHRLNAVCRLLAVLLPLCPASAAKVCHDEGS